MALVGCTLLLAGLGGCTNDPYPADAGTELRDGFQVLGGSRLLGPLFIRLDDGPDTSRLTWNAVLEVTGDPATVWRSYLDAADPDLNPDLPDHDQTYGCWPEGPRSCQALASSRRTRATSCPASSSPSNPGPMSSR